MNVMAQSVFNKANKFEDGTVFRFSSVAHFVPGFVSLRGLNLHIFPQTAN